MALSKNWQEQDEYIHYCRRCGFVAEIVPQDEEGHHLNCRGPIGSLGTITKEQYALMNDAEKHNIRSEIKTINNHLRNTIVHSSRPHCPMCKSTDFSKITTGSRMASIFAFGLASSSIGKQYKCNKCGHKW